jgi:hypothetical protein
VCMTTYALCSSSDIIQIRCVTCLLLSHVLVWPVFWPLLGVAGTSSPTISLQSVEVGILEHIQRAGKCVRNKDPRPRWPRCVTCHFSRVL